RRLKGRVTFTGGLADAYRACLWSRLASRIFVTIARFDCRDADDLYAGAHAVPWENILAPGATFAVSSRGVTDELRNSHFSALR
ncbi:THUMP domain-containing protein, partial [Acinetobacter baumannii]|nr:THUMP domain-containing protein [Acinetobacter baumannii]